MNQPLTATLPASRSDVKNPKANPATDSLTDQTTAQDEQAQERISGVLSTIKRMASLSDLIRLCGASAIVGSMFMFLMGGINVANDQQRFYSMLLFTGLLTAAGLAMTWILKEQRGARAFFGLSLVSVPVNFTVLGALFYSVFGADAASNTYPALAKWTIISISSLGTTAIFAIGALLTVTLLGFSTMARQSSKWLSAMLLGSSTLLLIPVRDSTIIVPLVAVSTLLLMWLLKRNSEGVIALKTPAGRFARALVFLPPCIMLVRSIWLYDVGYAAGLVICATFYILLRHLSKQLDPDTVMQNTVHIVSATVALLVAMFAIAVVEPLTGKLLNGGVFSLIVLLLTIELQSRVNNDTLQRALSICGTCLAAAITFFTVVLFGDTSVILFALLNAAVLLAYGLIARYKPEALAALMLIAAVGLFQIDSLLSLVSATGWWGVAIGGASAILLASLMERYGTLLTLRGQQWFGPRESTNAKSSALSDQLVAEQHLTEQTTVEQPLSVDAPADKHRNMCALMAG